MLQVRLFGTFEVHTDRGLVALPTRRDTVRLWQYLLLNRSLPSSRDVVVAALWPDVSAEKARGYLRINLHALAAFLAEVDPAAEWLRRDARSLQWDTAVPADIDLETFDALSRRLALSPTDGSVAEADWLPKLVGLYRGDLLAEVEDDWADAQRASARDRFVRALDALASAQQADGHADDSAATLERLLAIDPLHEGATRRLMALLADRDDRGRAVEAFQRLECELDRALGAAPSPETAALARQIASATPDARSVATLSFASPSPGRLPMPISRFIGRAREIAELIELVGAERLVTLLGPGGAGKTRLCLEVARGMQGRFEHGAWFIDLTQLGASDSPWPVVARALGMPAAGVAAPESSVLRYLAERNALLILDNCEHTVASAAKLATSVLTASSKVHVLATSRTPLCAGGEMRWSIPPLGLPPDDATADIGSEAPAEAIQLFIDRVRSIRSRFTPTVADARAMVQICRRVDGLPLAIELAAARTNILTVPDLARRLVADFRLLRADTPSLPERHRTIEACITWSYELTSAFEHSVLAQLSVFPSTFTVTAVEAVCLGGEGAGTDRTVLDGLARLVDVGLVSPSAEEFGERRFRLLEPIHDFARRRTDGTTSNQVRERHAEYFLARAESVESELRHHREGLLERSLEAEVPDFRAALDWWADRHQFDGALRICGAIWRLWYNLGHCTQERDRIEAMLAGTPAGISTRAVGRAAIAVGALAYRLGDFPAALRHFESAVQVLQGDVDVDSLATALEFVGFVHTVRGEPREAQDAYERLLSLDGTRDDLLRQATIRHTLGLMQSVQGDLCAARETFEEIIANAGDVVSSERMLDFRQSLARVLYGLGDYVEARSIVNAGQAESLGERSRRKSPLIWRGLHGLLQGATGDYGASTETFRSVAAAWREEGDALELARAYHNLAEVSLAQGDYPTARTYLTESRRKKVEVNDQWGLVYTDIGLATLAHETGAFEEALATAQTAIAEARERQDKCLVAWALQTAARAAIALGRLDEAAAALGECAALLTITCEQRRIAMAVERVALLAEARADHAAAARLLGAADGIRTTIGSPPTHGEAADRDACGAAAREALGVAAYHAAAEAGRAMSQREALAMIAQLCDDLALTA